MGEIPKSRNGMRERGASKGSHRSRGHTSTRSQKQVRSLVDPQAHESPARSQKQDKSLLESQYYGSAEMTVGYQAASNLEVMAESIRNADFRQKVQNSLTSVQKNETRHSSDPNTSLLRSHADTLTTTVSSQTKTDSRHPSPSRDRQTQSKKTRIPSHPSHNDNMSGIVVDVDAIPSNDSGHIADQSRVSRAGASHLSTRSSRSDGSANSLANRPVASVTPTKKTMPSSSTANGAHGDMKLSSERLEVLVMQLRETADEKEAATIVLEFALRIKSHELVIQGADISIINAMKRFSNSSKIQMRGCKALSEMACKGMPNILSIIDKGGSDMILVAMSKHRAEEDLQKEACRAIECIAKNNENGKQSFGLNAKEGIAAILHAMKDHPSAAKLQRVACRALASIAEDSAQCSQCLVQRGALDVIRRALKNHDDNTDVIETAFNILIHVASSVNQSALDEEIAMSVSMDRVLATLLLYRKNDRMQSQGMALLCILCKQSQRNRSKLATLYGLEVIMKSLENCMINKEVQRHGTTLIQYLSQSEGNAVAAGLVSDGGMELLLNIIRRHGSDPVIIQQVDLIIAKMARPFSDPIRKEGGIELILSGMRRHEGNLMVQEAACLALWKLAQKTENANVINENGGVSLINNALSRFPGENNIQEVACEALASLSHDKQMYLAQQTLKARATASQQKKPENNLWGACCF